MNVVDNVVVVVGDGGVGAGVEVCVCVCAQLVNSRGASERARTALWILFMGSKAHASVDGRIGGGECVLFCVVHESRLRRVYAHVYVHVSDTYSAAFACVSVSASV